MSLISGAETIIEQCLKIEQDESVLVLNDGNDQELFDALFEVLDRRGIKYSYMEYEEPENHGEEPPEEVAEEMKSHDVFIAPTKKSISHTRARKEANKAGARGATLPGVNREIWKSSLQADYNEVKRITEKVYGMLEETDKVKIKTPSGTDIEFKVDFDTYHADTGIIHDKGGFGNLPAGEPNGYPVEMNGELVVDHFPFAPKGTVIEVNDNRVTAVKLPEGEKDSELEERLESFECVRRIAEFGFGTNPEATLIGNVLQDEKVLGTVHIALGDNTSYVDDERANPCEVHWDTVCEDPTVWFDDKKVLDEGEPKFE